MSQVTTYEITSRISGDVLAERFNENFSAAASSNRGPAAPQNPFDGMGWIDTSIVGKEVARIYAAATGWSAVWTLDLSTGVVIPAATLPQIGAAPASHVGSIDGHPVATTSAPGMMPAVQVPAGHGGCRLVYTSPSVVTLTPYNGNLLWVNGALRTIPSGGILLSTSGLAAGTLYYVYAQYTSSTLGIVSSTTGYSVDATTGIKVMAGDSAKPLVGMLYCVTAGVVQDSTVASLFNRRNKTASISVNAGTSSSMPVDLDGSKRVPVLTFSGTVIAVDTSGSHINNTVYGPSTVSAAYGSGTIVCGVTTHAAYGGAYMTATAHGCVVPSNDGLTTLYVMGSTSGSGIGVMTFIGPLWAAWEG